MFLYKRGVSNRREIQVFVFSIPDFRESNLTRSTRSLLILRSILILPNNLKKQWNFPQCFGAMESKHIAIQKHDASSLYLYYKNTHSILPLTVAGPNYECLLTDFDANCDDGGIWK